MKKCIGGSGFPVSGAVRERLERDFFSADRRSLPGPVPPAAAEGTRIARRLENQIPAPRRIAIETEIKRME